MIILAAIIVGVLAVSSRGDDKTPLNTTVPAVNCSPIARPDAAAAKPGEPVAIDVLANDTDGDSDPLVFQILQTDGGTSAIDDGGTPTDSSDDRLLFTPAEPPVDDATIEYQALDPQGGFGTSTVAVYVNPEGALPPGVSSAAATDPVPENTDVGGRCGAPTSSTVVDDPGVGPVGPETEVDEPTTVVTSGKTQATTSSRRTTTTKKSTGKKSTTTTAGSAATTPPPTQPKTTTTRPPTNSTATTRPGCPDPVADRDGFIACQKGGPTTTAP